MLPDPAPGDPGGEPEEQHGRYEPLWQVVIGTTLGMLLANVPVVLLGSRFARRLPLRAARIAAAVLFLGLAAWVAWRGVG